MKLSENSNEVLIRAQNLKRSSNIPDLEESIRLFKVYSKMITTVAKKIEVIVQSTETNIALVNVLEHPDRKFWQFKVCVFYLLDLLKHSRHLKADELARGRVRRDIVDLLRRLVVSVGQKVRCYQYLTSSFFRQTVEEKYDYKLLVRVLSGHNTDISMSMIRHLPQEYDFYAAFMELVEQAFEEAGGESLLRPVASTYFVPVTPDTIDPEVTEEVDVQFLEEFRHEFKKHLFLDNESLFRFLLRHYPVEIKDGFVLSEFDAEVMNYTREIVAFFFRDAFRDPTEKKIVKIIKDGLRQKKLA